MSFNLNESEELFGLKVDDTAKSYLHETMRWTKFLGILTSIFLILGCLAFGFMILVYMPGLQTPVPNASGMVVVMSTVLIGINFYPVFALLKFSSLMRVAINTSSQQQFNHALKYLKNMFRYVGILAIIVISFYGLIFFIGLLGR